MKALGMVEYNSIPGGILSADAMLKAADVRLVAAQAVCAGKYFAIVSGHVDAVNASVAAGKQTMPEKLVDSIVIPRVHPTVLAAVNACAEIGEVRAVGVMETFSLASAILAADAAVKAAEVQLIEVRLGRGLGGKSFIVLTGGVAAVEAAVKAGESLDEVQGLMAQSVVIPSPHKDLAKFLL